MCHVARVRLGSRSLALALAFAIVCPSGEVAAGRHGSLDPTFGVGGVVISPIPRGASCAGIAFEGDGGFLLPIGDVSGDLVVRRYTREGRLDRSYGADGVSAVVHRAAAEAAIAFQADGEVIVAAPAIDGQHILVVRYGANGALDAGFGQLGVGTLTSSGGVRVTDAAVFGDGTVVVADSALAIYRLTANGSLLGTLIGGAGVASVISTVAFGPGDRTFLAGLGGPGIELARLSPDLSLDATFGGGLVGVPLPPPSLAAPFLTLFPRAEGGVFVGYLDPDGRPYLVSVGPNGDGGPPVALGLWPEGLGLQSDDSIVVAGPFQQSFAQAGGRGPRRVLAVERLDASLRRDDSFGKGGLVHVPGSHMSFLGVKTSDARLVVAAQRGTLPPRCGPSCARRKRRHALALVRFRQ